MIKINMLSTADSVKGQGVGAAYNELIDMLRKHFPDELQIMINDHGHSDITHFHTIDPRFFIQAYNTQRRGVKIGYVHFLPDTLEGSIKVPKIFTGLLYKYVLSFYNKMDELVVVNPSFIDALVAYGLDREKITYIPNFVSKESFYPETEQEKSEFRQSLEIDSNALVVLGVGQIQKRKGIDDFVQLAIDNPHIQFVWAGGFSFGQITDGYEKYKKIYDNPPANLLFVGMIDRQEMNRYYNLADIFLLPSYNELFPMAILEAFSCGTAVMLRDLDLYHAIIMDYYIPTDDRHQMNEQLNRIYHDRSLLSHYKSQSLKASEQYSEDAVAKIWYDYYTNLVQNHQ